MAIFIKRPPRSPLVIGCTLLALLLIFQSAIADLSGQVISITDGDTCTMLIDRTTQVKVRLAEIDAPERGQPFGTKAREHLSSLVFGKAITVKETSIDRYGRTVGRIYVDGLDVSAEMVSRGAAWVYRAYSKDPLLLSIEDSARSNQIGLWSSNNPIEPWLWRRGERERKSTIQPSSAGSESCNIKGNINSRGDRIYHVPGSKYYQATQIDATRGERWFCSEAEARSAGWRAPRG